MLNFCYFIQVFVFTTNHHLNLTTWGGRVVRRSWVNFQCRGVLLIWNIVGQGPIMPAVGAGGGCLDIFSLLFNFSFFLPLSGRRLDID